MDDAFFMSKANDFAQENSEDPQTKVRLLTWPATCRPLVIIMLSFIVEGEFYVAKYAHKSI